MLDRFRHVVKIDFEFCYPGCTTAEEAEVSGENPIPVSMVAHDLRTGQTWKQWHGEFGPVPPFPHGDDTVIVAYMAAAEISCYLALGWPLPKYVLDLYVEFRRHTNGYTLPAGTGQIGALVYFGIDAIDVAEKEEMRALILTGGPWSAAERVAIFDYNESDVIALDKLLPAMLPHIDMPRALLRGCYMVAVALMEWYGIPIDVELLNELRRRWKDIRLDLITEVDAHYGVYDGDAFKVKRWDAWLARNNIPWPRYPTGALMLDADTFKHMAQIYPTGAPMHELRATLAAMRKNSLAVGRDGRNRTSLRPFSSVTSRNQPSNSKYAFGLASWMRGLIRPRPGYGMPTSTCASAAFDSSAAVPMPSAVNR
jgi:DNA polymerase I